MILKCQKSFDCEKERSAANAQAAALRANASAPYEGKARAGDIRRGLLLVATPIRSRLCTIPLSTSHVTVAWSLLDKCLCFSAKARRARLVEGPRSAEAERTAAKPRGRGRHRCNNGGGGLHLNCFLYKTLTSFQRQKPRTVAEDLPNFQCLITVVAKQKLGCRCPCHSLGVACCVCL